MRVQRQAGFTLIELMMVCTILGILSAMAIPRLLMAKQAADASSAIGSLRTIVSSEVGYAASCGSGFYSPNLTTLGVPPPSSTTPFISPDLSAANSVLKSGYLFQVSGTAVAGAPTTCNGLAAGTATNGFKAGADPIAPSNTRFFATNVSATIYEDSSTLYATMPEEGAPSSGQPLQ